jgi:hypothetical protein
MSGGVKTFPLSGAKDKSKAAVSHVVMAPIRGQWEGISKRMLVNHLKTESARRIFPPNHFTKGPRPHFYKFNNGKLGISRKRTPLVLRGPLYSSGIFLFTQ